MVSDGVKQQLRTERGHLWGTDAWRSLDGDAERVGRYSDPRPRTQEAVYDEYMHRMYSPVAKRAGAVEHQTQPQ